MEIEKESGWKLHPIGGETGQAFMGIRNQEKVFLKKNSSPFLATLSLEGITPRLVWTKRTGNGDILTAQEWCNGRTLERNEMTDKKIVAILNKLHQSAILKRLLNRISGIEVSEMDLLEEYENGLTEDLKMHPLLDKAYRFLTESSPLRYSEEDVSVCHADLSNKNVLLSEKDNLYLVDWDTAILMDYLFDIGQLIARYVEKEDWMDWAEETEQSYSDNEKKRIYWYVIINLLLDIKYAHRKNRFGKMNELILKLNRWLES
ncbi:MAG: phosphotransferase family protein [Atopostipes suicloacalis]|nr:phosphotransferase family protein [Atopostipes suicloacalis]